MRISDWSSDVCSSDLKRLHSALAAKAEAFADIVKIGRTHLQDAAPLTLGDAVGAWAHQVAMGIARVEAALPRLYQVAQGGTTVGTGVNAPRSEEHTSELQSLMRISYAVFCLKKKKNTKQ